MKNILVSLLVVFGIIAAVSTGAQDKKAETEVVKLSVTEDEVVKFIAAFPEFIKENKDLKLGDPKSVSTTMTSAATDLGKWEAFAKDKGFTGYDNFLKVTTAVTTAYAYQLMVKNADDLENNIRALPAAAQGLAKTQLKPVRKEISKYKDMITPETLKIVESHGEELKGIFALIPSEKSKLKKK